MPTFSHPEVVAVEDFEKLVREVRIPARGPGLEIARGKSPRSKLFHVPLGENEQKLSKNAQKCANGKLDKDEMANLIRAQSVAPLGGVKTQKNKYNTFSIHPTFDPAFA